MKPLLILISILTFVVSCDSPKTAGVIPPAVGGSDEIIRKLGSLKVGMTRGEVVRFLEEIGRSPVNKDSAYYLPSFFNEEYKVKVYIEFEAVEESELATNDDLLTKVPKTAWLYQSGVVTNPKKLDL